MKINSNIFSLEHDHKGLHVWYRQPNLYKISLAYDDHTIWFFDEHRNSKCELVSQEIVNSQMKNI